MQQMACQAVINKLDIFEFPNKFVTIWRLEKALVSRTILFKRLTIKPKFKSPQVKGSICNVPVSEVESNCAALLRSADSNGILIAK